MPSDSPPTRSTPGGSRPCCRRPTTSPAEAAAALHEALALWRGPALAEYADEPWAAAEIARLTELRSVGRERLLAARLDLGEAALVAAELEGMVAEEPLREERWRLLALGLYRAHRQADALAALRRARETLADELGVDPGPALRELEAQVLAQSPELVPAKQPRQATVHGNGPGPQRSRRPGPRARRTPVDAGRPRGRAARPAVVRGSGRDRKDAAAGRGAQARGRAVRAGAVGPRERAGECVRVRRRTPAVRGGSRRPRASRRAAAWCGGREPGPCSTSPTAAGPKASPCCTACTGWRSTSRPRDQWYSRSTMRSGVTAPRSASWHIWYDGSTAVPVLVLATLRTGEQHDHEDLIAELALEPEALVVRPAPLSTEATAELVERRLGVRPAPLFVTACERTTAGNPFLLCQLLQALAADGVRPDASHADRVVAVGSRAVSSRVLLQLRRLPPDVVVVARAASVLGDGAALPAVAALAGRHGGPYRGSAGRTGACRDRQGRATSDVRHTRSCGTRCTKRSRRPSGSCATSGPRRSCRSARTSDELVAAHLLLAPPRGDENVVTLLRTAAREAAERGASESAVTYLRRALVESPMGSGRGDVVLELGMREAPVDGAAAVEHLVQAYRLQDDPRVRSEIAIAAASTQVFASPPGVATTFAREAAAALP